MCFAFDLFTSDWMIVGRLCVSRYRIYPSPVPNYATIREETCWPMRASTIVADGRRRFGRSKDDESRPPRVIKMLRESVATVFFKETSEKTIVILRKNIFVKISFFSSRNFFNDVFRIFHPIRLLNSNDVIY